MTDTVTPPVNAAASARKDPVGPYRSVPSSYFGQAHDHEAGKHAEAGRSPHQSKRTVVVSFLRTDPGYLIQVTTRSQRSNT